MGEGGFPPPLLPQYLRRVGAISESSWWSVFPPVHYAPQLVRDLALPSPETPSCTSRAGRPNILRHPPVPKTPLPRRSGFGGAQQVTPLQVLPTLQEVNHILLPLHVANPRLCHHPGAGFVYLYPGRPEWMAYHPYGFLDIYPQTHLSNDENLHF